MKPGMGRRKGHDFERAIANLLKPLFPDARRGLDQPQGGGRQPDVDGTPFWIETKCGWRTNIKAAVEQAWVASTGTDRPVVAITKDDHETALATMRLGDWISLIEELQSLRGQAQYLAAASDELVGLAKREAAP